MSRYHRLNVNEREEIALGLAQGRSQHDIAVSLGRSPSAQSATKLTVILDTDNNIELFKPSAALID